METSKIEAPKATAPIDSGGASSEPQPSAKPRRGRGRPFGSRTAAPPLAETPIGADPLNEPQDAPRQQRKRKQTVDVGVLAKNLKGIHALMAKMVPIKGPDGKMLLELDDTEATELANAVAGVAKEYDLELSGKTGSAITLFGVAAMIYGPRIYVIQQMRAYMQQQQKNAAAAARAADGSVVDTQNPNVHLNGQPAAH
jgi:hypothetical protein